jgi:Putative amidoligase enzyme
MPAVTYNMRGPVHTDQTAREDLAYEMRQRSFPVAEIIGQLGFANTSQYYRAIKAARLRVESNEYRVSQRCFGIEIEFNGTRRSRVVDAVLQKDPEFPIQVQSYNHEVQRVWKMITDSSVNGSGTYDPDDDEGDGEGLELVSPILSGQSGFDQLELVVKTIREVGGDIDSSCGFHVHHDARDLTPYQVAGLLRFYIENQEVIDRFLAPVRRSNRNNQWCQPWDGSEKQMVIDAAKTERSLGNFDRYRTINVTAYPKYGSLEFRQHQGTLNLEKMVLWVKLGQSMVEGAMHFENPDVVPNFTEPSEFLDWLVKNGGLPRSAADRLLARSQEYDARIGRRR